jgi:serine/threonine-protein kinase
MSHPSDNRSAARFVPRVGAVIAGKYRIEKKLGEGGMGVVVAASHMQLGGKVALKFLVPGGENREDAIVRLLREAQSVVRIKSEHVAKVLDVGTLDNGDPYIVMELLEGSDLNKLLHKNGPLAVHDAVEYTLQAAEAVAEAHAVGIIHRDLKPANVFLTYRADGSPFVKVLDFGIAKSLVPKEAGEVSLTVGGDVLGSPLYMSPEQIRNPKGVDPRADVWSLGAIIYKLLTGRAAFEADNPSASLAMIIADDPMPLRSVRPDVPAELDAVVRRCLEKRLDLRYQSVDELACALLPFAPQKPRGRPWVPTSVPPALLASGAHPAFAPASMTTTGSMPIASPMTTTGSMPVMTRTGSMPMIALPTAAPGEATIRTSRRWAPVVAAAMSAAVVLGGVGALLLRRAATEPEVAPAPSARPPEPPPVATTAAPPPTAAPAPLPSAEGTVEPPAPAASPKIAPKASSAPTAAPATTRPRTSDDDALDDRL